MSMLIRNLRVEYLHHPAGIDIRQPRLGWLLDSSRRQAAQSAYQVLVASSRERLDEDQADMWDSGKVRSDRSHAIRYEGRELQSGCEYVWKVKVWDRQGEESSWSDHSSWSMGLLSRKEWEGKWIGLKSPRQPTHAEPKPAIYMRGAFQSHKPIRRAILYAAALGCYELYINGSRISDSFAPEWTDYNIRLQYQTFDVTAAISSGENMLAVLLGHGWYSGYIGMYGYQRYGKDPRMLLQLNIEYADGSRQSVVSGPDWKASFGPLIATDFHMGEIYDASLEMPGWQAVDFDDGDWMAAEKFYDYKGRIVSSLSPPIHPIMELAPVSVTPREGGRRIVDMGQNMVGYLRLALRGKAGTVVTIRHGEALDASQELYTENLRLSRQIDIYTMKGSEEGEVYEPHFTLHGFRYAEISSGGDDLELTAITGVVVHSDLTQTGFMETSNLLLNRLLQNIEWTQRSNFISVPTDCPQRDERLGWSGDAQVFFRTASYLMDTAPFFTKWLTDLTDAQRPTGAFTDFAPFIAGGKTEHGGDMTYDHTASAGWGDAGVLVPWMMYQVYGDKDIISRHYEAMTRWIEFLHDLHPGHLREDLPQFGDWLSMAEARGADDFPNISIHSTTPYDVFATAYYAYSTELMSRMAALLGKTDDAVRFRKLNADIKEAFNHAYVDGDGKIKGDTQSAYALALSMNLLPEEKREFAVQRILYLLEQSNWHMSTGIHGTKYLLTVLAETGYEDIAYRLLNQQSYPSWYYSILQGATTIWERWDGWTEEKGFQRPGMNSFNHYALGSVGEWIFRYVGGIDLDEEQPGYKHIRIHPRIGGDLEYVNCRYDSIQGTIACNWHTTAAGVLLNISIPANTTASISIPRGAGQQVRESGHELEQAEGIIIAGVWEDRILLHAGSGEYEFVVS
ncbi:alpha-L-rhamnosidase [Paenibacillus nasutitermitis]|uniref:alpha-L-rhamnosidase n=1 Tax=Paenibacillus nasutitermitis TaxID=1652958 RepID=A0A916YRD2_9BACL|nr:alpha-L-rhamnosidase [Paenibacillus nasutitermitis]GGD57003.1 alfa-L-rhamnosidase [Paenibacillus nasutitermitis]